MPTPTYSAPTNPCRCSQFPPAFVGRAARQSRRRRIVAPRKRRSLLWAADKCGGGLAQVLNTRNLVGSLTLPGTRTGECWLFFVRPKTKPREAGFLDLPAEREAGCPVTFRRRYGLARYPHRSSIAERYNAPSDLSSTTRDSLCVPRRQRHTRHARRATTYRNSTAGRMTVASAPPRAKRFAPEAAPDLWSRNHPSLQRPRSAAE
jgi:hypothetical protein